MANPLTRAGSILLVGLLLLIALGAVRDASHNPQKSSQNIGRIADDLWSTTAGLATDLASFANSLVNSK